MRSELHQLWNWYEERRHAGVHLALAVITQTHGSTYKKAGGLMLIDEHGDHHGLISGGCVEARVADIGARCIQSGQPEQLSVDLMGELGVGCPGRIDLMVLPITAEEDDHPLALLHPDSIENAVFSLCTGPRSHPLYGGFAITTEREHRGDYRLRREPSHAQEKPIQDVEHDGLKCLHVAVGPRPALLLLGAGLDTPPLASLAAAMLWKVSVYDHRAAFADPQRFKNAYRVICGEPEAMSANLNLDATDAAVIMTHNLELDKIYLAQLATCELSYLGLLGPATRGAGLLSTLPELPRCKVSTPAGLDLGGRGPEAVALAIAAEIQRTVTRTHSEGRQ